jgi:hypothetical protein
MTVNIGTTTIMNNLPKGLRDELFNTFNTILKNYHERKWEPTELNGGKLCEITYSILNGHVNGNFPQNAKKPSNMYIACQEFEKLPNSKYPRSIRIQIPRMMIALYEIRNNRGVGHIGGDVDPNSMDATAVLFMSKWIMAELIRIFHDVDVTTAKNTVDKIIEHTIPIIWKVDEKIRILRTDLSMREKTLLILYHMGGKVDETDLVNWIEHTNPSIYRRDVLKKAHKDRQLEYDQINSTAEISPKGIKWLEDNIDFSL